MCLMDGLIDAVCGDYIVDLFLKSRLSEIKEWIWSVGCFCPL